MSAELLSPGSRRVCGVCYGSGGALMPVPSSLPLAAQIAAASVLSICWCCGGKGERSTWGRAWLPTGRPKRRPRWRQ